MDFTLLMLPRFLLILPDVELGREQSTAIDQVLSVHESQGPHHHRADQIRYFVAVMWWQRKHRSSTSIPNICPCSTSSSDANTSVADTTQILIDLRSRRLACFRMRCDAMLCVAIIIGSPIDDATGSRASRHPIRLDSRMSGAARLGTCWCSHCSAYRSLWRSHCHPPTMRPMPSTHQYASSFTTRSLGLAFSP